MFGLVMSIYVFSLTIANSGMTLATTRIISEELAKNIEIGAKVAIKKCIHLSLIFGLLSS